MKVSADHILEQEEENREVVSSSSSFRNLVSFVRVLLL